MDVPIPPAVIHDAMSGLVFSRGGVLGEGGFARCFEVQDDRKQRLAAKVVAKCTIKTKKQRQKLSSEIKIHERLLHQNVVRFYHKFEDDQFVFMIMELCENKTLVDLLKHRKRLTESETRGIMAQLLSGVQYMHSQSVIHRDLKLGNLFLDRNMQLKIGDFGLAAVIQHNGDRKKTICGTPNYIAPEVLFDTQNGHSYEVDIWSVGVVMYTLLVGKPPFQKKDVKAIYKKIRENSYEFPPEIELSVEAKSLITSLLHSQPECRPALEQIMEHDFFKCGPVRPISVSYARPPEPHAHIPGHQDPKAPQKPQMSVKPSRSPLAPVGSNNITNHPSDPSAKATGSVPGNGREIFWLPSAHITKFPARRSHNENDPYVPAKKQKSPVVKMPGAYTSPNKENLPTREEVGRFLSTLASASRSSGTEPSHVRQLQRSNSRTRGSESSQGGHSNQVPGQPDDTSTAPMDYSPTAPERIRSHSNIPVASQPQQRSQRPLSTANVEWPQSNEVPAVAPTLFVSKWIDYSNKYGLGYQLRDGSVGVYFNDSTSIILSADGSHFEYLFYDNPDEIVAGLRGCMHRESYTLERFPPTLNKKVTLLKHFRGYMLENLNEGTDGPIQQHGSKTSGLDFVTKYMRTKISVVFRLSNQLVQINFNDHTKMILSDDGLTVTYVNLNREMSTKALVNLVVERPAEILERLAFAKDILSAMLKKRGQTAAAPGANT
ncbi:kinase-like domain-containing protein, partial [Cladochytrium replicatum]